MTRVGSVSESSRIRFRGQIVNRVFLKLIEGELKLSKNVNRC